MTEENKSGQNESNDDLRPKTYTAWSPSNNKYRFDADDEIRGVSSTKTPRQRARLSGIFLTRLAIVWGVLSFIGALILAFTKECQDYESGGFFGTYCAEETYPYVAWAIAGLLANLMVSCFLYAVGSYIEAQMSEPEG